jgi:tetratricopeptide (TPR) repeat protein
MIPAAVDAHSPLPDNPNTTSEEALAAWREIDRKAPGDAQAAEMISVLVIHQCRVRGGLEERPIRPGDTDAAALERKRAETNAGTRFDFHRAVEEIPQTAGGVSRTPVQQLETAVREFPSHPELYLELAPLYLTRGRLFDAERLLTKGLSATGQDVRVRQLWEEVTLLRLEEEIRLAQKDVERDDSNVARGILESTTHQRDRVRLEIFQARAKREPDNGAVLYELGQHLKAAGRTREAIKAFHQAIADPRYTTTAAYAAGQSYEQDGDVSEALRLYRVAAEPTYNTTFSDRAMRQQALQRAAQLAERLQLPALAQLYNARLQALEGHATANTSS